MAVKSTAAMHPCRDIAKDFEPIVRIEVEADKPPPGAPKEAFDKFYERARLRVIALEQAAHLAFDRIAAGKNAGVPSNSPIIKVLTERGLIERVEDNIAGDIRFEFIFVPDYRVPKAVPQRGNKRRGRAKR